MSQRINFYTDAYRPKIDYLSLNLCAIYLGSFVGVLLLITLVQVIGQQSVRGELRGRVGESGVANPNFAAGGRD